MYVNVTIATGRYGQKKTKTHKEDNLLSLMNKK